MAWFTKSSLPVRRGGSTLARREARWGILFISPWIIGFLLFTLAPMIASFVFTFLNFDLANPDQTHFIGLENWKRMLFIDPEVWPSFLRLFKLGIVVLPVLLVGSLSCALLLNSRHLLGKNLFRTLFFVPSMVPMVAAALIWNGVLNEYSGWFNIFLERVLHVEGLRWTNDPNLIYVTYAIIGLWGIGNPMIVYLAGLQGVPTELYDAAIVDGAGWWGRLFSVTLPMISPMLLQQLLLAVIGLMQYFLVPFVLNGGLGSPQGATRFPMVWFYRQAFTFLNMGYGATLAWMIFAVAMVLTVVIFSTSRRWVYYAGERNS